MSGSAIAGAQTTHPANNAGGTTAAPASTVHLPPAPTAPIATGDTTARTARATQYAERGDSAFAAGLQDTARVMWEDALYEDPRLTDVSIKLATLLVQTGAGFWAKRVIERALHFDPNNPKLQHFSAYRTHNGAGS
jgi:Tfp pilus assembly protein PilF